MQSYQDIPDTTTLTASRLMLLSNILTSLSSSSGTAFPTANLQVGMLCFRTDQSKLYQLKDVTPTWYLLFDLSGANALVASATAAASAATLTTARTIDGVSFDGGANILVVAPATHAATTKTTPVDADEIPLSDSAATFGIKKLTWANLKATLKTYFDALYVRITTATGSSILPSGTTAQRDVAPASGYLRYNSTLNQFEGYGASAWGAVGGGATGAPGNAAFYENDQAVTADYTLTTGKNAITAGPITVNTGVTVTIPTGAVWSIT